MAFEIYSGKGTLNDIIDKMIEMWNFDSTDTTSSVHTATYGNAVIKGQHQILFNGETPVTPGGSEIFTSNSEFKIVKTDNSIMACWYYYNSYYCLLVGNVKNVDGTVGKGALARINGYYYAVTGTVTTSSFDYTSRTVADGLIAQLVPIVASGGWYFDNAYFKLVDDSIKKIGKYMVGDDVYYIHDITAIKEE